MTHEPMLGRPNCWEPVERRIWAGGVIEGLGVHGADDGDVVCVGANVREDVGHFGAGLTVFLEFEFWPEEIVLGVDKGGLVVLEEFGGRFGAIEPGEFGFVVEEIEVAGGSAHEEVDDVFSLSPEVGILGRHGIKVPGIGAGFEGCEGDGAEAEAAVFHTNQRREWARWRSGMMLGGRFMGRRGNWKRGG